jgi:hypothetical protein
LSGIARIARRRRVNALMARSIQATKDCIDGQWRTFENSKSKGCRLVAVCGDKPSISLASNTAISHTRLT